MSLIHCGVNSYSVKFWKNQVIFTARLTQRESFVSFVTTGIRLFRVWRYIDLLTAVRSLPLLNSSLVYLIVSTKLSVLMSVAVILQGSIRTICNEGVIFYLWILISGKHRRKRTTSKFINQVLKLHPPAHLRHDLRTPLQCKVFLSGLTTIQASGLETWNPLKTNSEKKIER